MTSRFSKRSASTSSPTSSTPQWLYEDALKNLQSRIKAFNRAGGHAITATTNWTVNGSKAQGQRMVNEVSKLMLRAYNGEVDDSVRTLKPQKIDAVIDRLNKVRASIEKLGKTMSILVSSEYHSARIEELKLTADFLQSKRRRRKRRRRRRSGFGRKHKPRGSLKPRRLAS